MKMVTCQATPKQNGPSSKMLIKKASKKASSMGRLGVHGRLHHENLIKVLKKGWLNLPNQELTERQMMKTKQQDLVTRLVVYPAKKHKNLDSMASIKMHDFLSCRDIQILNTAQESASSAPYHDEA